jgi:hypothetical protein
MALTHASTVAPSAAPRRQQFAIITLPEIGALHGCSAAQIQTYLVLAAHAGPTGECWPGRTRLGELTHQSRENVSRATRLLEVHGLVEKHSTAQGHVIYRLPLHTPAESTPPRISSDTPPVSELIPVEQISLTDQEQRDPELAPVETTVPALSQDVLRTAKTPPPDTLPPGWIDAGQLLRPDLDPSIVRASAEVFLDHSRSQGKTAVDWLAGFRVWLRRERSPKPAQSSSASSPSPYASWPVAGSALRCEVRLPEAVAPVIPREPLTPEFIAEERRRIAVEESAAMAQAMLQRSSTSALLALSAQFEARRQGLVV